MNSPRVVISIAVAAGAVIGWVGAGEWIPRGESPTHQGTGNAGDLDRRNGDSSSLANHHADDLWAAIKPELGWRPPAADARDLLKAVAILDRWTGASPETRRDLAERFRDSRPNVSPAAAMARDTSWLAAAEGPASEAIRFARSMTGSQREVFRRLVGAGYGAARDSAPLRGQLLAWAAEPRGADFDTAALLLQAAEHSEAGHALAALIAADAEILNHPHFSRTLRELAKSDPQAALALIPDDRPHLAESVYAGWASADPEATVTDAFRSGRLPSANHEGHVLGDLMSTWVARDPDKALAFLADVATDRHRLPENANDDYQRQFYSRALKPLSARDPESALEFAESCIANHSLKSALNGRILMEAAAHDPRLAAEIFASGIPLESGGAEWVAETIGGAWAKDSPEAALDWAQSLTGRARREAVEAAARHLPEARQLELIAEMLEGGDEDTAKELVHTVSSEVLDTLMTLGAALPDRIRSSIEARKAALGAPGGFADALSAMDFTNESIQRTGQQKLVEWTESDPVAAAAWVDAANSLPATARGAAIANVAGNWARHDPAAASRWLAAQPDSPTRDTGAAALADRILAHDPDAALAWLATVDDAKSRSSFFRDHAAALAVLAPGAARELAADGFFGDRAAQQLEDEISWRQRAKAAAAGNPQSR